MNKADSDRIHELCSQIAVEQDRTRLLRLVTELNGILSTSESQFSEGTDQSLRD
jgi:hypothetical protein